MAVLGRSRTHAKNEFAGQAGSERTDLSRCHLNIISLRTSLSRSNGRTLRSAILVKTRLFAYVQIFDYRHIRSTLLATSILLEIDRDLPEIESFGRSLQCFGSNA